MHCCEILYLAMYDIHIPTNSSHVMWRNYAYIFLHPNHVGKPVDYYSFKCGAWNKQKINICVLYSDHRSTSCMYILPNIRDEIELDVKYKTLYCYLTFRQHHNYRYTTVSNYETLRAHGSLAVWCATSFWLLYMWSYMYCVNGQDMLLSV